MSFDLIEEGNQVNIETPITSALNEEQRSIECSCVGETDLNSPGSLQNKFILIVGNKSNGMDNLMGHNAGPISFDQVCREVYHSGTMIKPNCAKFHQQKLNKEKKRRVTDMGKKVSNNQSYFSCIAPRREQSKGTLRGRRLKLPAILLFQVSPYIALPMLTLTLSVVIEELLTILSRG